MGCAWLTVVVVVAVVMMMMMMRRRRSSRRRSRRRMIIMMMMMKIALMFKALTISLAVTIHFINVFRNKQPPFLRYTTHSCCTHTLRCTCNTCNKWMANIHYTYEIASRVKQKLFCYLGSLNCYKRLRDSHLSCCLIRDMYDLTQIEQTHRTLGTFYCILNQSQYDSYYLLVVMKYIYVWSMNATSLYI